VAFSLDDQYVIATTQNGAALMWDLESCRLHSLIVPFPVSDTLGGNTMTGIAWGPTKSEFAAAIRDGSVRLWEVGRLHRSSGKGITEKAVYFGSPSNKGIICRACGLWPFPAMGPCLLRRAIASDLYMAH
jgi:hypothetical protein